MLVNVKRIQPRVSQLEAGLSCWLGALARIDFVDGEKFNAFHFLPASVTIHTTTISKANEVFIK